LNSDDNGWINVAKTTFDNGSLDSCFDEEHSEM
jgi:hypothetical protein